MKKIKSYLRNWMDFLCMSFLMFTLSLVDFITGFFAALTNNQGWWYRMVHIYKNLGDRMYAVMEKEKDDGNNETV